MRSSVFERAANTISGYSPDRPIGRISGVSADAVWVSGLPETVRIGDTVSMMGRDQNAEVIKIDENGVSVLPEGSTKGLHLGQRVMLMPAVPIVPDWSWVGRVIDPNGAPMDGKTILNGVGSPAAGTPPPAYQRRAMGDRLDTGYVLFDTMLPIVRGQRLGLFAGSGVGKSTLIAGLAQKMDADLTVIALVGERGREVREFVEKTLGPDGMARSIVVAATSDRAPQMRRKCVDTATSIAEFFRNQGLHVLLLVDSLTRFAEAHREVAVAAGEPANLRGFPASTSACLAELCERTGPGAGDQGDITAIYSVLVAGSDMEEPIADTLRGFLDGHIVMDRKIAEAGRYPAIDVLRSVSRSLPHAATTSENNMIAQVRDVLGAYDQSEMMIKAGLYEAGSDQMIDKAIALKPKLDAVFSGGSANAQSSFAKIRNALS